MKKFFHNTKVLVSALGILILTNIYAISMVSAGWNHLISGNEWESNSVSYDFSSGLDSNQKDVITGVTSWWENVSGINFDYSWTSGNDWWSENIDELGLSTISISDGYVVKVETIMDSDRNWRVGNVGDLENDEFDFASVAVHEWGHWLYLYDDTSHEDAVMYESLSPGEEYVDLSAEDIEAARYYYGW